MNPTKVNLAEKLSMIRETESPKIVGDVNDCYVKLVKLLGPFVWHHHEHEDEMFLVIKGTLNMKLHTGDVQVGEGEFIIIPRGVDHMPVADEEVHIMLFEPKSTLNTGNVENKLTKHTLDRL